ncbi:MAG TPA: hypothetical protein VJ020_13070 [Anaerolineales bacterium]|nr:hypothetical protein [Anaerolineales bacterium]
MPGFPHSPYFKRPAQERNRMNAEEAEYFAGLEFNFGLNSVVKERWKVKMAVPTANRMSAEKTDVTAHIAVGKTALHV